MSSSLKNLESRGLIERIQSADNKKHIEIVLLNKADRIIEDGIKAQKEFAQIYPQEGWVEHNPKLQKSLWTA